VRHAGDQDKEGDCCDDQGEQHDRLLPPEQTRINKFLHMLFGSGMCGAAMNTAIQSVVADFPNADTTPLTIARRPLCWPRPSLPGDDDRERQRGGIPAEPLHDLPDRLARQ
jgi:hypothetical protein